MHGVARADIIVLLLVSNYDTTQTKSGY